MGVSYIHNYMVHTRVRVLLTSCTCRTCCSRPPDTLRSPSLRHTVCPPSLHRTISSPPLYRTVWPPSLRLTHTFLCRPTPAPLAFDHPATLRSAFRWITKDGNYGNKGFSDIYHTLIWVSINAVSIKRYKLKLLCLNLPVKLRGLGMKWNKLSIMD